MTIATTAPAVDPELITLQDFFVRFSIAKSTWYRLAKAGDAPPIVKVGRRTLVPMAAARAWMQSRLIPAQMLSQPQPR
jgi:predicted DNA-binding transcriptional regulator AlpA